MFGFGFGFLLREKKDMRLSRYRMGRLWEELVEGKDHDTNMFMKIIKKVTKK